MNHETTDLREKLNKLIIELDRLDITLDLPASSMTLGEYEQERERLLDEFVQAIAATLGERRDPTKDWLLSVCNQATQDYVAELERKLEAVTFGSGECENIAKYWGEFECSECDTWADFGSDLHLVSYCPHCGKKVKR